MGSCGSWSASMSLVKKINLSQKEENSSEDIEKFVKKNPQILIDRKSKSNIKKDDILISVDVYDEDDEEITSVELKDIGLENVNAKDFIDNKVYEKHDEFEQDYIDIDNCMFNVQAQNIEDKLKFLNLSLLKDHVGSWSASSPTSVDDFSVLASCSDSIYCHNDNSNSSTFTITQKFIDSLNPGDILRLDGDGDGEHC